MRTTAIVALVAISTLAACAKKPAPQPEYVDTTVSVEPTYTGKYK